MKRLGWFVVACGAILTVLGARAVAVIELPQGPGKELVSRVCSTCHDIAMLTDTGGLSRKDWTEVVDEMEGYGASFTAEERVQIIEYLVTFLPPKQK